MLAPGLGLLRPGEVATEDHREGVAVGEVEEAERGDGDIDLDRVGIAAKDAFEAERCVVLFPAGRLARRGPDGALIDPPWATTAVSLAQKYQAPIIPAHLAGPDSFWFHLFDRFSVELRDITLFHEFLNKAGKRFDLRFGPLITGRDLQTPTPQLNEVLTAFIEHDLATAPEAQIRLSAPDSQH